MNYELRNRKAESGKVYDIKERTFNFSTEIIKLIPLLPKNTIGFELGKQLIRSGTSIGANVEEATGSRTRKEFINALNIAKKEARETNYWLRLLQTVNPTNPNEIESLTKESNELISILTTIVKNCEINLNHNSEFRIQNS